MAEWDDDNFEPQLLTAGGGVPAGGAVLNNKWEGEDEDDEVKDNWEDEEEEKEKKEKEEITEIKPKAKKKPLLDRIAEKERLKREEYERQQQQEEEQEISPEEQLRRQQESDLKVALETTFGDNNKDFPPKSKEEYQDLADTLTKNIQQYSKSEEYPNFAENIIRGVCSTLTSLDLKKIKTTIDNLYLEKQKIEKGDKAKKTKGRSRAKLRMEGDNVNPNLYSSYVDDYDEFNDFM